MTVGARALLLGGLAACCAAAAVQVLVMAQVGPAAGFVLPVALLVAIAVLRKPVVGVQLAILAVPLEYFSVKLGALAGLSVSELLLLLCAAATLTQWILAGRAPAVPRVSVRWDHFSIPLPFNGIASGRLNATPDR